MEEDIKSVLDEQTKKIDAIYRSVEKTRKYFLWTMIITAVLFILPLVGLLIIIPQFISLITGSNQIF